MAATPDRTHTFRSCPHSQSNSKSRFRCCGCEFLEKRILLSAAFFTTSTSVNVPGARAPLVADYFHETGKPIDLAVATSTSVQLLTGVFADSYTLGAAIPLPANPAAETPFLSGEFEAASVTDIVLPSLDSATGNGLLTYEADSGNATFTQGPVSVIANGGQGFTPLSGEAGAFVRGSFDGIAIIGKPRIGNHLVLAILTSNADGTFTEAEDYPIAGSNANGNITNEEVFTGINNEVVVYDGSGQNLDVFSGPGDGSFTQLPPMAQAANLAILATYNNLQDIVLAHGNKISLLVNQGDGTFQTSPQGPITLPGAVTAMTSGDFNIDGNNDIATNQGILFGNGNGTFNATPQPLPVSIDGGNNFSGTMLGIVNPFSLSNNPGFAAFSASGDAVVSAANQYPGVSIDLKSSDNPANPGADVTVTATVSSINSAFTGTPAGTVTFYNSTTTRLPGAIGGPGTGMSNPPVALGTVPLAGGAATFDAGSNLTGTNTITATYNGDTTFGADTSSGLTQIVLSPTTTTVASGKNPSLIGDDVVLTAAVSGAENVIDAPSGNVEFLDNGIELGGGPLNANGVATFDASASLVVGPHSITAQYGGDSNYLASISVALSQTVNEPAFVPTVTAAKFPAEIVGGVTENRMITVSIKNQTATNVAANSIVIFASGNGAIAGATSIFSETFNRPAFIKAGQTRNFKIRVKAFPSSLVNGAYSLLAQVVNSLNQTSNSFAGPSVNIAKPFVQLSVTGTQTVKLDPARTGKFITFAIHLTNSGNVASGIAFLNIGLSTDGQNESIPLQPSAADINIKPHHTGVFRVRVTIPTSVVPGSYQPYVAIDDEGDATVVIGPEFNIVT